MLINVEKTLFTLEIKKIYLNFIKTQTTLVNIKPKKNRLSKTINTNTQFFHQKVFSFYFAIFVSDFPEKGFLPTSLLLWQQSVKPSSGLYHQTSFLSPRELSVNILERYIATCLGRTTPRVLFLNKDLVLLFHKTMPLLSELTQQLFGQEQMCS